MNIYSEKRDINPLGIDGVYEGREQTGESPDGEPTGTGIETELQR
jgi:hypothetical protein